MAKAACADCIPASIAILLDKDGSRIPRVENACIRALLSERHGGFGSSYVIIIDAGNSSDIYSSVNFARQYGLDLKDTLKR